VTPHGGVTKASVAVGTDTPIGAAVECFDMDDEGVAVPQVQIFEELVEVPPQPMEKFKEPDEYRCEKLSSWADVVDLLEEPEAIAENASPGIEGKGLYETEGQSQGQGQVRGIGTKGSGSDCQ